MGEFEIFFAKVLATQQDTLSEAAFSQMIAEHEADLLQVALGGGFGPSDNNNVVKHQDLLE